MDNQSKIILIAGPTASGKSNFAVKLAKKIDGEIINADSMQVYRQLKILTARPNKKVQKNIRHHLYGIININNTDTEGANTDNIGRINFVGNDGDESDIGNNIVRVISDDLVSSGLFESIDQAAFIEKPKSPRIKPNFVNWIPLGAKALITGSKILFLSEDIANIVC